MLNVYEGPIGIILPTHNRAVVLARAVDSVLAQSDPHWRLYVVDDGSTDETHGVVESYLKDPRIFYIFQENGGVSAARNRGLAQGDEPWVCFLDSDDEWLPEKLRLQREAISQGHALIHGEEIWIRNGVRVNPMHKHQKRGGDVYADSLKLCCISPSTVMLKRDLLNEFNGFREDFVVCEDYDLWLKITAKNSVAFIPDFLIKKYGGHGDQLSRKFKAMDYWRIVAMQDRLNSNQLDEVKTQQTKNEIKKKCEILLKGYRKHGNLSHYDQIFGIWRLNSY